MTKGDPFIEKFFRAIAWNLPKRLVLWCFVRVSAHGTGGKYGDTHPSTLSIMDAMKRWEKSND